MKTPLDREQFWAFFKCWITNGEKHNSFPVPAQLLSVSTTSKE